MECLGGRRSTAAIKAAMISPRAEAKIFGLGLVASGLGLVFMQRFVLTKVVLVAYLSVIEITSFRLRYALL